MFIELEIVVLKGYNNYLIENLKIINLFIKKSKHSK